MSCSRTQSSDARGLNLQPLSLESSTLPQTFQSRGLTLMLFMHYAMPSLFTGFIQLQVKLIKNQGLFKVYLLKSFVVFKSYKFRDFFFYIFIVKILRSKNTSHHDQTAIIVTLYLLETPIGVLWQTVKTQMKCHKMQQFIRVCTVC